jgi:hypothetical protein
LGTTPRAVFGPPRDGTGGGGDSRPSAAATSVVVTPPPPPNVPPNPHPGNGNAVAYVSWLDHVTARILLLDDDMGGDNEDCNDKDNDDNRDGNCNAGREGRGVTAEPLPPPR